VKRFAVPLALIAACLTQVAAHADESAKVQVAAAQVMDKATTVPVEKNALAAEQGHPVTSVVVTQCNLVVAVYVTMPDGRLLRFDKSANVPIEQLLNMAYTATRSERVEVSCNDNGVVGYEAHDTTM